MKQWEDIVIDVEGDKKKSVVEMICNEIKGSLDKNSDVYAEAERSEQQYAQITKWMAKNIECDKPWKGATDPFIPVTEWTIDAIAARATGALLSQEPYATASAENSDAMQTKDAVTDFVDLILRDVVDIKKNFAFFVKQKLKLPFAVIKYEWVQSFCSEIIKDKALTFVSPDGKEEQIIPSQPDAAVNIADFVEKGYTTDEQLKDVWVHQDYEVENQAKLKYIRFCDYVWTPETKRGCLPYWEGDRFWMTMGEISAQEKSGKFIEGTKKELLSGDNNGGKTVKDMSKVIEMFHWYGKLPFNKNNEIDFTAEDTYEQEVHAVVAYKEKVLCMITRWEYERKPFPDRVYIRNGFKETEGFCYRSACQVLRIIQGQVNAMQKVIMDNAYLSMMKIFVKKGATVADSSMERLPIFPGAMINLLNTQDLQPITFGDVSQIGLEIQQQLLKFAEQVMNVSVWQTGGNPEKKALATEINRTISESNIGIDAFIDSCAEDLKKICEWTVAYYYERMPEGFERAVNVGGDKTFGGENGEQTYWTPENLYGKFSWKWNGTRISSMRELNIAISNDIMQQILPHPMAAQNMLMTWEILRDALLARGRKDLVKLLPPREAIIAEMKQKAMAEKAKTQLDNMPTAPEMAADMLKQKGIVMTPQEVEVAGQPSQVPPEAVNA